MIVWYQTIGEDAHPVFDESHQIVIFEDGKYDNPDGMDDFMLYFERSWREALEQAEYDDCFDYQEGNISELQQAMSLFMIDSLDEITPEGLKALRNKLIKTFHPDAGTDDDTKHAQKINAAYEIIKNALK